MNTLFARLSIALLVIVGLMGAAFFVVDRTYSQLYYEELSQTLNAPIAMYVTDQRQLITNGEPDIESLHDLANHAMVINPTAEIYLLDTDGKILGHAMEPDELAAGFVQVANASMAQAIANVSVGRGVDPRDCALVGFGGAAGVSRGDRVERDTEGYFMTPAVFAGTKNDWQVNREELFAPIACVIRVDSYDEALATVNDTRFGLTAGIITSSLSRATHFRRNVKTGCVMVNLPTAGTDYHVPFGGRGESSYGPREQGQYAQEFYTTVKTSYILSGEPA